MFKETPEGSTHHDKDACYKCKICGGHYLEVYDLFRHLSESLQCSSVGNTPCMPVATNKKEISSKQEEKKCEELVNTSYSPDTTTNKDGSVEQDNIYELVKNANKPEWEERLRIEINSRLRYALGDVEPFDAKMIRTVDSIFNLLKQEKGKSYAQGKSDIIGYVKKAFHPPKDAEIHNG